ncbi:kelch-like protein 22 isoform X2 [Apteryx rowi]|uniref:kelch-like protein 22 isoform X2 n=1 Tax=Apteryx rowi TaxID=308060 RepID=UPI000E1D4CF5|nr:kelch-like protein 22 isoform X2 [Apteryx rowi]
MAEDQELTQPHKAQLEPSLQQRTSNTYRSAEHSQALLSGLVSLRDSSILFDVVLVVEEKPIEAHRILLAASCDYFRGMFAGGLREMEQDEVRIHGISYNAMCKILNFIYTSELELSVNSVQETLAAACQLQIPEVIKFCCDFLMSWVDEENILDVYRLADHYDLRHLSDQLDSYILKNFVAFSKTQMYRQLPFQKVYSLLSSNRLEVNYENEVYEGALLYHYSPEQLETDQVSLMEPPKLLETVRFPLMEPQILQRLHDKLSPCPLKDKVADALMYHKNECLQPMLQSSQTQLRSEFQCVVGFGGMHSTPSIVLSDQAKYLNPLLGEWRHFTAPLAPRMSNQGIAVLNNFVYLIGGDNNVRGFRAESRCWRYDPRHNRWFQIRSLQQEHADLSVCVVGDYIYAVAGRDYHEDLREVERYDPKSNTWEYVTPLKKEVACYRPSTDQWTNVCPLPAGHGEPGIAVLDNRIYVLGGRSHNRGIRMDYVHIYDAERDCWEEGPQLEDDISGMAACVLTLPRAILMDTEKWYSEWHADHQQNHLDFPSEVMSVSDWEEFDSSSED